MSALDCLKKIHENFESSSQDDIHHNLDVNFFDYDVRRTAIEFEELFAPLSITGKSLKDDLYSETDPSLLNEEVSKMFNASLQICSGNFSKEEARY